MPLQAVSPVLSSTKVASIPGLQLSDSPVTSPVLLTAISTVQLLSKLKVISAGTVKVGSVVSVILMVSELAEVQAANSTIRFTIKSPQPE